MPSCSAGLYRAELRRQEGLAHARAPAAELELLLELAQAPGTRTDAAQAIVRALAQGVLVKEQARSHGIQGLLEQLQTRTCGKPRGTALTIDAVCCLASTCSAVTWEPPKELAVCSMWPQLLTAAAHCLALHPATPNPSDLGAQPLHPAAPHTPGDAAPEPQVRPPQKRVLRMTTPPHHSAYQAAELCCAALVDVFKHHSLWGMELGS